MRGCVLQGGLDDIVGKRVAEQAFHLLRAKEFLHNHVLGRGLGAPKALLNHVGAELVAGQLANAPPEHAHDGLGEGGLVQVDDVLDDVVAKGVLHKDPGVLSDALDEPQLLVAGCVVDAALQDAAAMSVSAHLDAVVANSIKDELGIRRGELVKTLLNDVVAVEVLDELDNSETERLDDEVNLLRSAHILNHLLQRARAVLVEGNAHHVLRSVLDQDGPLVVIAKLKELLAQIITKWVRHELDDVLVGLEPNRMNLLSVALFQFLLKIAATMLVLAQVIYLASKGVQRHVLVAGHGCSEGLVCVWIYVAATPRAENSPSLSSWRRCWMTRAWLSRGWLPWL